MIKEITMRDSTILKIITTKIIIKVMRGPRKETKIKILRDFIRLELSHKRDTEAMQSLNFLQ